MAKLGEADQQFEHIFKSNSQKYISVVVLIGDTSVGKTCLLNRYMKDTIPKHAGPTIGVEFATKTINLKNDACVKAQIWDTAGQEKYRAMTST